jgi:integrase
MAWRVAEQLGRVAWSKSHGHHVDFRTVRFDPRGEPRRVRILRADFGRIESARDAQRVLNRIRGELANGHELETVLARYLDEKLPANLFARRWADFCEAKRAKVASGRLAARRVYELERYLERGYFARWAETTVHEIGEPELLDWLEWMRAPEGRPLLPDGVANAAGPRVRAPLGEKTIKNVLGDLGQFLRWLGRRGIIDHAPRIPTDELVLTPYAPTVPDRETVAKILAAIPLERRGLWIARAYMGLRPSEARRLDVGDLREGGRALQLLGRNVKTRKPRLLPIAPPVASWLAAHRDLAHAFPAEPLFPNPQAPGRRWRPEAEYDCWTRACADAGVPRVKPNEGTRHFWATDYVERTGDIYGAKAWLDHSDISTTERYARLRSSTLARVVALPKGET